LPHATATDTTPYQLMFNKEPSYDHLREFGAVTHYYRHPAQRASRDKWEPNAQKGVFMGYVENMKAYKVWDDSRKEMIETSRVDVSEGRYYWKETSATTEIAASEDDNAVWWNDLPLALDEEAGEESSGQSEDSGDEETSDEDNQYESCRSEPASTVESPSPENANTVSPPITPPPPITLRRSERTRVPIRRLDISNPSAKSYADQINELEVEVSAPKNYREAMSSVQADYWNDAMINEMMRLMEQQVYEVVDRTSDMEPISTRFIYKLERNSMNQAIEEHKARLVVRGFEQDDDELDYAKIFAPVVTHATVRAFLTHAAVNDMAVHHVDVKRAFLNSPLEEEVYVYPPEGFEEPNGKVWRLLKGLYGLKQAPRCWFDTIHGILLGLGFKQCNIDQCVYWKKVNGHYIFVLLYVDDFLVASSDPQLIEQFKIDLTCKVEIHDMGPVSHFLGLKIEKDEAKKCYIVCQDKLITEYVNKFGLSQAKPIKNLTEVEHYPHEITETNYLLEGDDICRFRKIIGGLLYITNQTRPDASFAVSYLSRFMQKPIRSHMTCAKKVLQYLDTTRHRKLHLGKLDDRTLTGYADASFASTGDFKSQSGILFTYHGSLVYWTSKKQPLVSGSTTEAETVALYQATEDSLLLRDLLNEWGAKITGPTTIYEDNQQTIKMVHTRQIRTRTKHLAVKYAYIHEKIVLGQIGVTFIPTKKQWADLLTKSKVSLNIDTLFSGASPH